MKSEKQIIKKLNKIIRKIPTASSGKKLEKLLIQEQLLLWIISGSSY